MGEDMYGNQNNISSQEKKEPKWFREIAGIIEVGLVKVVASDLLGEKTQTQHLTHFVYVEASEHVNAMLLKLC
jgi:hypothetical protein